MTSDPGGPDCGCMRRLLYLSGLVLTACSGPSLLVVGEGVPPAPAIPELEVIVTDPGGEPIEAAAVDFGDLDRTETDGSGKAASEWPRRALTISAGAPGFHPGSLDVLELPDTRVVRLSLDPVILSGVVQTPKPPAAQNGVPWGS